jgi:hypothetical protein
MNSRRPTERLICANMGWVLDAQEATTQSRFRRHAAALNRFHLAPLKRAGDSRADRVGRYTPEILAAQTVSGGSTRSLGPRAPRGIHTGAPPGGPKVGYATPISGNRLPSARKSMTSDGREPAIRPRRNARLQRRNRSCPAHSRRSTFHIGRAELGGRRRGTGKQRQCGRRSGDKRSWSTHRWIISRALGRTALDRSFSSRICQFAANRLMSRDAVPSSAAELRIWLSCPKRNGAC